jgi:hypothetical protein
MPGPHPPYRQVRASFTDTTVRVYQAYAPAIAEAALAAQTFRPPFKRERMTWIKPSFTWMMYRCGWGTKPDQERILGIDVTRAGFEWALAHACLSTFDAGVHDSFESWREELRASPVRVQWDPEKTVRLRPLPWRSIQVGLVRDAVDAYVDRWITGIEDLTALAREVHRAVDAEDEPAALAMLPHERPYPLPAAIARRIGCTD